MKIEVNDEVIIRVKVRVHRKSDSHGSCFQVELPRRDYEDPRYVWVDVDEIQASVESAANLGIS